MKQKYYSVNLERRNKIYESLIGLEKRSEEITTLNIAKLIEFNNLGGIATILKRLVDLSALSISEKRKIKYTQINVYKIIDVSKLDYLLLNRQQINKIVANRPEVKRKQSEISKIVQNLPEVKEKKSISEKIAHNRLDVIEKQRKSIKKTLENPKIREKISINTKIAMNNPIIKEKHRNAIIKLMNEPGTREKISKKMKEKWNNPEYREKMKKINKEIANRPEVRKKQSEIGKIVQKVPEVLEKHRKARANQIFPLIDTLPEKKAQNLAKELYQEIIPHKYIGNIAHPYQCDIYIPETNTVVEIDGNYWHNYPHGKEIDHIRTKEMIEAGYKVVRIWEKDIMKEDFDKQKLKELLKI